MHLSRVRQGTTNVSLSLVDNIYGTKLATSAHFVGTYCM